MAAKLAVGYTLDELKNDITNGQTPASFEPTIDYVITKIPRFDFHKFPNCNANLTTQMKSVGEVMAIGRSFQESFQKALRGLENKRHGLDSLVDWSDPDLDRDQCRERLITELTVPGCDLWMIDAFRFGMTLEQVHQYTRIDPWFLVQISSS